MYVIRVQIKRRDPTGVTLFTESRPPQNAADALRSAQEALDRGWNFEIFDAETGRNITVSDLRKAANV